MKDRMKLAGRQHVAPWLTSTSLMQKREKATVKRGWDADEVAAASGDQRDFADVFQTFRAPETICALSSFYLCESVAKFF